VEDRGVHPCNGDPFTGLIRQSDVLDHAEVKLLPLVDPPNIICLGLNYREHAACVEACSAPSLTMEEGKANVDEEKCILCGYCAAAWPEFLIRVVREAKTTGQIYLPLGYGQCWQRGQ
jgi:ferredoxin